MSSHTTSDMTVEQILIRFGHDAIMRADEEGWDDLVAEALAAIEAHYAAKQEKRLDYERRVYYKRGYRDKGRQIAERKVAERLNNTEEGK